LLKAVVELERVTLKVDIADQAVCFYRSHAARSLLKASLPNPSKVVFLKNQTFRNFFKNV